MKLMTTKEIRWRSGQEINEIIVRQLEEIWKVKFPIQYVDIVLANNGSRPQVKDVNGKWKEGLIDIPVWGPTPFMFLSFLNPTGFSRSEMVMTQESCKICFPEPDKIFPFADDGMGNTLCFDYRNNENEPSIVFLYHERAYSEEDFAEEDLRKESLYQLLNKNLYRVCSSFSEFICMLYPDPN